MLIRNVTIILIVLILSTVSSSADDGLSLMKIGHSARISGMGESITAVANDVNGSAYNPATVNGLNKFTVSFGHVSYWDNVNQESLYFGKGIRQNLFWHGGIRYAGVDDLKEYDLFPTDEPLAFFESNDISIKTGFTYNISPKISAGVSFGWFIEKLERFEGSAFNFDFGLLGKVNNSLSLGASAVNIGSSFQLTDPQENSSRDISLPSKYSFGASYVYQKYLGAVDVVYTNEKARLHLGAEAAVHELFKIRSGYMFNYDSKNFSAGVSFSKRNLTVDYAFVPYSNDLGTAHHFNLSFSL